MAFIRQICYYKVKCTDSNFEDVFRNQAYEILLRLAMYLRPEVIAQDYTRVFQYII